MSGGLRSLPLRVGDDAAYIIPMAVLCGFTVLQAIGPQWFAPAYAAKTLICPVLLIALWPHYARISWKHWPLGVAMGVLGVVQWVVMGKLILKLDLLNRLGNLIGMHSAVTASVVWDPFVEIHPAGLIWPFIALRWLGPTLVVPFVEELFWRDYLWRSLAAPNDFRMAAVGEWDARAFWLVPVFFSLVHVQIVTALAWGLMIGWLLLRTRSLGACIVMHGVTNFLLGAYVLYTHDWYFW